MNECTQKSILQMARGAIQERADYEMSRLLDNILDPKHSRHSPAHPHAHPEAEAGRHAAEHRGQLCGQVRPSGHQPSHHLALCGR